MVIEFPHPSYTPAVDEATFNDFCRANAPECDGRIDQTTYELFNPVAELLTPVEKSLNRRPGTEPVAFDSFYILHSPADTLPGQRFGGEFVGAWHLDPLSADRSVEVLIPDRYPTDTLSGTIDTDEHPELAWINFDQHKGNEPEVILAQLNQIPDYELRQRFGLEIAQGTEPYVGLLGEPELVHRAARNPLHGQLAVRNVLVATFVEA